MATDVGSARAGTYAKRRYVRGLRAWRSKNRVIFVAGFGPFVLTGLAGLIVAGHEASWGAGVFFGLGMGGWMTMRDSPPPHIANWQTGAEGARKTQRAPQRLESSRWLVAHDIECRRGNYDHIVVGRAGVFMLDSKN